ncbi:methylated-DNA--[protein]-cysteine S-methyltransferase [Geopsychrobacter electrodiphilus]|uniref:methylated-DNA--[protein]-cysteine S-methyltransferase n=1 Tax=Geopsychrobacter electrodiphilus TaxID=225196 RepID=UPI0003605AA1|nr:methylated-DNA--[protein]-cysteine S-methyltransferase [Geopsychrobacter electrodiphilus]
MSQDDYQRVAQAIRFMRDRQFDQPELDEVAAHLDLSPFHFQRLFQRWAGVSPKRFLQYLTSQYAKTQLKLSASLLETSWEVGLSGSGRLHDLFVVVDAVTPGEFKTGGQGVEIRWGVHSSPFGACLIGVTTRGICALSFVDHDQEAAFLRLRQDWPNAQLTPDKLLTRATLDEVFRLLKRSDQKPLPLLLKGTNFQLQVWQALLRIPPGQITSYGKLARGMGAPNSSRAVGSAIGANPIAWLIPCHRVLRSDGLVGGYRWGEERKLAILGQEFARADQP